MNATVATLTRRSLLGRKRTLVLLLLPMALVGLCTLARVLAGLDALPEGGLGLFIIRNFMDDLQLRRVPEGGMEVRMVKKLAKATL